MTNEEDDDRREFLKSAGRFAAVTPPTITFLLSTSLTSKAIAGSSGKSGHTTGRPSSPGNSAFGRARGSGLKNNKVKFKKRKGHEEP